MNVFAHRGCAKQYPENTVDAFERAAPNVDAVELDVRRCGSGELVVFHDERLDRLTTATARIDETPLGRLRLLDVAGTDEPVPTLTEALAAIPDETLVNVELKTAGIAAAVHETCSAAANDVLVSSFETAALAEYRDVAPETPVAVVESTDADAALAAAQRVDATAIHPSLVLAASTDLVERAHDRGLCVNVWTLTEPKQIDVAREHGVDGVIVDRWDIVD